MSYLDQEYREIITKAVCGKGSKLTTDTNYVVPPHKPTSILGCWVINHVYHAKKSAADCVEIHGKYDINIWYSFNDNTKTEVVSEKIEYCDEIILSKKDEQCIGQDYDIIAKTIQQPNCLQCKIEKQGNRIAVEVEREFVVKVIGETKVNVKVGPTKYHEEHKSKHHGMYHDDMRTGPMRDKRK